MIYTVEILGTRKKLANNTYKKYVELTQKKDNCYIHIDQFKNTINLEKHYKSKSKATAEAKKQKIKFIGNTQTLQKFLIADTCYILYKYDKQTKDIKYMLEFTDYQTAKNYLKITYNIKDIKNNITKNLNNLIVFKNDLVLFKDIY